MMKKQLQRLFSALLLCVLLMPCMATPAAAAGFTDVPASHWAAESIQRCVDLGVFQGESASRFGMGHKITRAAFTVVLGRFFGWESQPVEKSTYADVPADAWYAGAVEAAYAHGALTRQSEAFRPQDPITREELAVMLVRALGYGTIAGLVQELPMPFRDVTTNAGYITMAYDLGLVSGTSDTTFSPDGHATREQAAVMLMRLYDKLHGPARSKAGIAASVAELADLTAFDTVVVAGGQLVYQEAGVQITAMASAEDAAALRAAAQQAEAKQLYYACGTENVLRGESRKTAQKLADIVTEQGYDGLYLDLSKVSHAYRGKLTALAADLREALGEKLLYVAAEAPAWQGKGYEGYDYPALAGKADQLVLRVASYTENIGEGFTAAPVEPLEEVYYALGRLSDQVPVEKLTLLLTTTAEVWTDARRDGTISGSAASQMMEREKMENYYSNRYACAYLMGLVNEKDTVIWYLDGVAAAERARLAAFFGVDQICFTQLNGLWPNLLEKLK